MAIIMRNGNEAVRKDCVNVEYAGQRNFQNDTRQRQRGGAQEQ
jgi:hypothetical protein